MSTSSVLFLETMDSTSNQHVLLCTKLIVGVEKNPPCAGSFLLLARPSPRTHVPSSGPRAHDRSPARPSALTRGTSHMYISAIFPNLLAHGTQVV